MPLSKRHEQMRHSIMIAVLANGVSVTGELWLELVFMTESGLAKVCQELCIQVPPKETSDES